MTDKMREEFRRIVGVDWLEGAEVCKIWQLSWQASRESAVIDLPSDLDWRSAVETRDICADRIRAVGLKVKTAA